MNNFPLLKQCVRHFLDTYIARNALQARAPPQTPQGGGAYSALPQLIGSSVARQAQALRAFDAYPLTEY